MAKGKKSTENGEKRKKKRRSSKHLEQINLDAAGIDIGSREHYVAVPEDRATPSVRSFGCYTGELYRLADWLKECKVKTVVMEATGVYWMPVYQVLEDRGFEVKLADARQAKHVPGRKSDVADCQWLQQLHTYGLLSGSFIPDRGMGTLRTYWRHRSKLVLNCTSQIHQIQKSLDLMNLHVHKALSDITGKTGLAIVRAIVAGERDLLKLAKLKDRRVRASVDEIAQSLTGHYREEHVFTLKQALAAYDFYQGQIQEVDGNIQSSLSNIESKADPANYRRPKKKPNSKNAPHFDLHSELYRICGVDLTKIDRLSALTAFTVITEIGLDMSRFPTEKNLGSYLGLCPNNSKTGGKVKKTKSKNVKNPASLALRLGAQSLHGSQSALGGFYRRMYYRLGGPKAITAAANKLCHLVYYLLKNGEEYVDRGLEAYEKQFQAKQLRNLKQKAKSMGLTLMVAETGEVVS